MQHMHRIIGQMIRTRGLKNVRCMAVEGKHNGRKNGARA
ncbi:hypothetical protein TPASS_0590 [Treponema pallidum subsp. pallidum SS14]|uniref:Ribosomal protein L36 (RpmJ-2) n=2 Tax=Treponema pallidum subsp. pallidum TaxID=161 RepID=O83599_TREPA|nr:ribosomal protein L36 (rpmJ-2) [Treponema pallidum subsp. pallidum str. Nichols]ACD71010.1 hypothetical protein TPASS_0590 [Treponema pallidum subsp. pallidum SS14]